MLLEKKKFYASTPRTLYGLVALVLLAAGGAPAVFAQTSPRAKIVLRAMTRDDIAAYKLPPTTQTSGGLSTVGIGQPAHLEALVDAQIDPTNILGVRWTLTGKPAGSNATIEESPLPSQVPSYEPADRADYQIAARKFLRPDVPGIYNISATVETSGGNADLKIMITAGTYLGSQQCATCHSGGASPPWSMVNSWEKTAHASMFKNGVDGERTTYYGSACIACHTVGYDTDSLAMNNGFDDVAKQLNWTFPALLKPGTFDTIPAALKNLANIQCENCHGPGSRHASSGGDPRLISTSSSSGVCGQCHGALTHHSKTGEWNNSMHAQATRDPSGAGREGCVGCHTGAGFIGKIQRKTTIDTTYSAINCQTCHEPHGDTIPNGTAHLVRTVNEVKLQDGTVVTGAGMGMLCMNCHQSRQNAAVYAETAAASLRFGPHHGPQTDMLEGVNGYSYGQPIPSSAHGVIVEDTCVTCHMQPVDAADPSLTQVGGHTFRPASDGTKGPKVEMVGACQSCHGKRLDTFDFPLLDYDGDGKVEGVQTEVKHLLSKLGTMLPPVGQEKTSLTIDSTWTRPQLKAAYNYQFVANDGSYGIHNMAYTVGLLKASIADLQANNK